MNKDKFIPFNRPTHIGNDLRYMDQAFQNGHISGDGEFTRKCCNLLKVELGSREVLLTTSCTHALEMASLLINLEPGDEVIVPSYTFVSTVTPFVLRGAKPVFVDVRPDTLNMDEALIESAVTAKTKVIVVVHYGGVACEMDKILEIAKRHKLFLIEDNAHGLFGKYKDQYLGTFGDFGAQSFHETKNFSCGEGGALVINNPKFVERAYVIREKGTDRTRFFRGEIAKYTWIDVGSSYLPSDLLAAVLFSQLEKRAEIEKRRRAIWDFYYQALDSWSRKYNVQLPVVPADCEQPYHMFYLIMPSNAQREGLIEHLKSAGILSVFHYQPLHLSDMGRRFGGNEGDCPVTERVCERIVRLPFYYDLSKEDQSRICKMIADFSEVPAATIS